MKPREKNGVVVACVSDHPRMIVLLRTARNHAQRLGVPWVAIHVEDKRFPEKNQETRIRILQNMTHAEEMGAMIEIVDGRNPHQGVSAYIKKLQRENKDVVTVFVGVNKSHKKNIFQSLFLTLDKRLKKKLPEAGQIETVELESYTAHRTKWLENLEILHVHPSEILYALLAVGIAIGVIELIAYFVPEAFNSTLRNRTIIMMVACAFTSARFGLLPGLIAAGASFAALGLLYLPPYFSLTIDNAYDKLSLVLFFCAATLIALLTSGTRRYIERLNKQMERMQAPFRMYRTSLRTHTYQKTLAALHKELTNTLKMSVIFYLPTPFNPDRLEAAYPIDVSLSQEDLSALDLCWQEAKVTGFGTPHHSKSFYRFKPLLTPLAAIGVMAIRMDKKTVVDDALSYLLTAIADTVALILERLRLGQAMEDGRVREEREKLRAMLLSSVSHDLKTPLASIIGSLSVFRSMGAQLPEDQRNMLIHTALEEAQRLDSFITNILDMTRIESGQISFKQEWIRPTELMVNVKRRLRDRLRKHELNIQKDANDGIEICIDTSMTEQVMQNILDNAGKYTPAGSTIEVTWAANEETGFSFQVRDHGPGIPEEQLEKIFDKYTRIKRQDSQIAGTGLGLAIARSVMSAQGGTITVSNHPEGGALFIVTLPKWRKVKEPNLKVVA